MRNYKSIRIPASSGAFFLHIFWNLYSRGWMGYQARQEEKLKTNFCWKESFC